MADLIGQGYVTESASLKALKSGHGEGLVQEMGQGGYIYIQAIPLINNGKTEMVLCTERDITETMKLKELLKEKEEIAEIYETELKFLRKQNMSADDDMIIASKEMLEIMQRSSRIAKLDTTVLITGKSGTGKEILANYIYKNSTRNHAPFIKINCAAIPESLIESEFFGYEKGSFTGANVEGKRGFFDVANNGTLFLDEVGELPLSMQSKLLRAIQEKEIMRIGGSAPIPIDVRIIAATNKNLEKAMEEGKFREDLFYRLNVIPIDIPPLKHRKEDIELLALSFIEQFNRKYDEKKTIEKSAVQVLLNYEWPGNIRQLKNIIERLVVTTEGSLITEIQVIDQLYHDTAISDLINNPLGESLQDQVAGFEQLLLKKMLSRCSNATEVAKAFKVNKSTISKKFKKYGIHCK
jgi:transcriptional regulator with PAS, ATPase and Fis domain